MKCQCCGGYNITDYGDGTHWQCKDCHWIFLKEEKKKKKEVVEKVLFDEENLWV